ncbi:surface protein [Streptomyces monticola]|uniref:Surface protein n=1 Tax=Streptomyces monticola TaxID=2666263 RepID=A0ABW2JU34_9ACTN
MDPETSDPPFHASTDTLTAPPVLLLAGEDDCEETPWPAEWHIVRGID